MVDQLVVDGIRRHGRFPARPKSVDPLHGAHGLRRLLRRTRLKEWVGFALVHPDLWASMIVQDAKYLSSSEVYAYDRQTATMRHHEAVTRGGVADLPTELFGHTSGIVRGGYQVSYAFADPGGAHEIRIDIAATKSAPRFQARLEVHGEAAAPPLSVSAPLPGGSLYTYKVVYPVGGTFQVGDREYCFEPTRDFAILDEHRSFLPYRTRWTWGTFAARVGDPDGIVGANFASRPSVPGSDEESCIWSASAAEPLADIAFEGPATDPLGRWAIRSRDGRLDVSFTPVHRQAVKHQLGVFAIDYFMLYGTYNGTVISADGTHHIDGVHGVCERMNARL